MQEAASSSTLKRPLSTLWGSIYIPCQHCGVLMYDPYQHCDMPMYDSS